jgi:hypothetical protein
MMVLKGFIIAVMVIIACISGCVSDQESGASNRLSDEDWDYFVFHYTS